MMAPKKTGEFLKIRARGGASEAIIYHVSRESGLDVLGDRSAIAFLVTEWCGRVYWETGSPPDCFELEVKESIDGPWIPVDVTMSELPVFKASFPQGEFEL